MIFRRMTSDEWYDEGFKNFVESLSGQSDDLVIYLDGNTNNVFFYHYIYLDFINQYKGEVTIMVPGFCAYEQAAFFLACNSKKIVTPMTALYLRKPYIDISSCESKETRKQNKIIKTREKSLIDYMSDLVKNFFTEEELKLYESGEDVVLLYDRLPVIIQKAEKLFYHSKKR